MSPHQSSSEATALKDAVAETKPDWELACPSEDPELGIPKHDRPLQGTPRNDSTMNNSTITANHRGLSHESVSVEDGKDDEDALQIDILEDGANFAHNQSHTHHPDVTHDDGVPERLHTQTTATAAGFEDESHLPLVQDDGQDEDGGDGDIIDEDDAFSDQGYAESSGISYCSTLRSEAEDYYWEHGRRYHSWGGGQYLLPNDDQELNREDMKHHMWRLVLDGALHLSPIGEYPQKILDVGTGSGIWAMQTADFYPSAEIIGFDISPVQPNWVPPNLQFEADDLEQEWLWKPNSFDLIHCRFMFMSVRDWPAMLAQAYHTLKPGGYIELSELDLNPGVTYPSMPEPPTIKRWFADQGEALKKVGFDMRIASKFKQLLIDAGFEHIVEEIRDVPWGQWSKDEKSKMVGYWHLEQLKKGLHGIIVATLTRAGWQPVEIDVFTAKLKREMDDPRWNIKDKAYIVYGRKPMH